MRHSKLTAFAFGCLLVISSACAPKIDVAKDLQVADLTTGWFDAGIIKTGENKIVPTVAFKLKNVSDKLVTGVQINVVFRLVNEPDQEMSSAWVRGIGGEGLKAGETTKEFVLKSHLGYTGLQPRAQMLQNRLFTDAIVDVYLKQGSQDFVRVAHVQIARQLLTQ